jgi:predicted cobalt transporter CbtA
MCISRRFFAERIFWIASCMTPQGLALLLLLSHSRSYLLKDVVVWIALSVCRICQPKVAKSPVSEH